MTSVFLSVVGQDDNLGDSILRRGLVRAARQPSNTATHLFVGSHGASYLSALGLDGSEILHRTRSSWNAAMKRSLLFERTVIGFNSGEVNISRESAHLGWSAVLWLTLARLRGGGGFHTGLGIRDPLRGSPLSLCVLLRLCFPVTWRDEPSRKSIGLGSVAPDWAFGELGESVTVADAERKTLIVTMRGDRPPPSASWLEGVSTFARTHSLEIIVTSHVLRDNSRTRELAQGLGASRLLEWQDGVSHESREASLRGLYGSAVAVVSDRLHALIIGATEGAMPMGLSDSSVEKLYRTLGPAGLSASACEVGTLTGPAVCERLEKIYTARLDLTLAVLSARLQVRKLATDIGRMVSA